jgi:hypothetical protein
MLELLNADIERYLPLVFNGLHGGCEIRFQTLCALSECRDQLGPKALIDSCEKAIDESDLEERYLALGRSRHEVAHKFLQDRLINGTDTERALATRALRGSGTVTTNTKTSRVAPTLSPKPKSPKAATTSKPPKVSRPKKPSQKRATIQHEPRVTNPIQPVLGTVVPRYAGSSTFLRLPELRDVEDATWQYLAHRFTAGSASAPAPTARTVSWRTCGDSSKSSGVSTLSKASGPSARLGK